MVSKGISDFRRRNKHKLMKSNADVDFVITDEDMDALKRVETIKDYSDHSFFPYSEVSCKATKAHGQYTNPKVKL